MWDAKPVYINYPFWLQQKFKITLTHEHKENYEESAENIRRQFSNCSLWKDICNQVKVYDDNYYSKNWYHLFHSISPKPSSTGHGGHQSNGKDVSG